MGRAEMPASLSQVQATLRLHAQPRARCGIKGGCPLRVSMGESHPYLASFPSLSGSLFLYGSPLTALLLGITCAPILMSEVAFWGLT